MTIEDIAMVCHEVNRAYCEAMKDQTQKPWDTAPQWQRISAVNGVRFHINNPHANVESGHENWYMIKKIQGWKYGPIKSESKKEHPCMMPFEKLPIDQQIKDYLFRQIVHSLRPFLTEEGGVTNG